MFHATVLFIILFASWVALSGYFEPFFLISGVVSCALTVLIARRMDRIDHERTALPLSILSPVYWLWLAKEVVLSSIAVTRLVWQRTPRISPTLAWIPSTQTNAVGNTVFANSITLTPGTVSVVVENERIQVHALEASGIDSLLAGDMDRRARQVIREG